MAASITGGDKGSRFLRCKSQEKSLLSNTEDEVAGRCVVGCSGGRKRPRSVFLTDKLRARLRPPRRAARDLMGHTPELRPNCSR